MHPPLRCEIKNLLLEKHPPVQRGPNIIQLPPSPPAQISRKLNNLKHAKEVRLPRFPKSANVHITSA